MKNKLHFLIAFLLLINLGSCSKKTASEPEIVNPPAVNTTFTNPLLQSGPDPWVFQKDTTYYYTHTFGDRIALYKTNKMSELQNARPTTIWTPSSSGNYSKNIWAPEIHYLQGKWYVYFAADDGDNKNHRIYALENSAADPVSGTWVMKGKVADPSDKWAIDGSVFEYDGHLYFVWSGWQGDTNLQQDIYIAAMSNPWTIEGNRVKISSPAYDWERIGSPDVNEGPQAITNPKGHLFITFSASGCWTDDYSLGLLALREQGNPLNPDDWSKLNSPVFSKKPENGAFAPGHNAFFKSRDGKEDWIIYHANSFANQGCGDVRSPRMQKFTWNVSGFPNFGEPVKINTSITKPSGE